jgi:ATP-dependent DNA helicase RecG
VTTLDTPLRTAIGKGHQAFEKAFGMRTVGDLLYHFPRRYDERGDLTDIASLRVGEDVTIQARVNSSTARTFRNGKGFLAEAVVADGSGRNLTVTFFAKNWGQAQWRRDDLRPGRAGLFAGTVSEFNGKRQLTHPEYILLGDEDGESTVDDFAGGLIPVYAATKDIRSWVIARCVRLVLQTLQPPPDPMPVSVRRQRGLMDLHGALTEIHQPASYGSLTAARARLTFDEALAVQVSLVQRKLRSAAWPAVPRPSRDDGLLSAFDADLPYTLTDGQREVGAEIAGDLAAPHPMHRLLQGEVGSGKTVCALRGMLQVVDAGGQAALLAPTEVLAAQHLRSIRDLLGPLGRAGELDGAEQATEVALVTGSQPAAVRRKALASVASGAAGIVVGTHALLYEGVEFRDLGLVVVDEQHRFGVEQRDTLRAKADQPPHVLVMTATPIPRTVAMTVFGDLETSTLSELPRGRSPIATHVVPAGEKPAYVARAWTRLREEVEQGHQAYVVCPRIGGEASTEDAEDSTVEGARRPPTAVLDVTPKLLAGPLAGLRVGVLHGRLPSDEKDAAMRDFSTGKLDVLVATTVIEVGVDVPNATVMIVLDADRFGLSQLHQLRGRVGRGSAPGLCLLVTESPAPSPARERLDAVASTLDGFRLAELDLELRREAIELLRDDPELTRHPALAATVAALVDEERAEFLEKG